MKNRKRRSAAVLAAGMSVLLGAGTITGATEQTDADNSIRKEETVYVNTEADGTIKEITVSEWLKNAKTLSDSTITDISDLSDIKNTKGDEGFTQDGKTLTWETDGRDIHYEGKTEKDLPVTVTFSYELDGRKIKPEDLAGKTGHLKIHVAYENHAVTTKKISGKSVKLYSPFMMLTGMILSTDHFSNVTVDNGKVVEDDSRNIVLGIAMPGLKESLDLSEDMAKEPENPKSVLQERLQEDGITPTYRLVETQGPPHDRTFVTQVFVGVKSIAKGVGRTKKESESQAAKSALEILGSFFEGKDSTDKKRRAEAKAAIKAAKAEEKARRQAEQKARKKKQQ